MLDQDCLLKLSSVLNWFAWECAEDFYSVFFAAAALTIESGPENDC